MSDVPSFEDVCTAISRGIRTARMVDPDDGTIPFFLVDGRMIWVSTGQALDTIAHEIVKLWAIESEG